MEQYRNKETMRERERANQINTEVKRQTESAKTINTIKHMNTINLHEQILILITTLNHGRISAAPLAEPTNPIYNSSLGESPMGL